MLENIARETRSLAVGI